MHAAPKEPATPAPTIDARPPSLLSLAARGDLAGVTRYLAEKPSLRSSSSESRRTALHAVALCGSSDAVPILKLLLDAGSSVFAEDHDGRTPLCLAVSRGTPPVARALLAAINEQNVKYAPRQLTTTDLKGWTAIHLAARSQRDGSLVAELMEAVAGDPTSSRVALKPLGVLAGASAGACGHKLRAASNHARNAHPPSPPPSTTQGSRRSTSLQWLAASTL